MILMLIFLGIVLLLILFAAVAFALPFYNPIPRKQTPYDLPPGPHYEPYHDQMRQLIHRLDSKPYEQVYITARDGARLAARYYHAADGAPVKIEFHGYRGTAVRDFCGAIELDEACGYNILLVDQRAHGKSDGRVISFGIRERYDAVDWAEYVVQRFGPDVKIILSGVSMGGTTVLMASGLDLPPNVRGIIADCGFTSPGAIIREVCRADYHLPVWLMYPMIWLTARIIGGFDLDAVSAADAVAHSKVPIILFHGADDAYVPCDMAREIHAAGGDTRLNVFPNAGHAMSYLSNQAEYHRLAIPFFESVLQDK